METVLLGLPGPLVSTEDQPSLFETKIGGCPVVHRETPKDVFSSARCGVCDNTHAPLRKKRIESRWLYVFGCVEKECGRSSRCFKAFRIQIPEKNKQELSSSQSQPDFLTSGSEDTLSLQELKLVLENQTASKKPKRQQVSMEMEEDCHRLIWERELPEFYIYAEKEPSTNQSKEKSVSVAESLHIEKSFLQYSGSVLYQKESDWSGEVYEKAGYKSKDHGAFWRFQKVIQRSPTQCVRYGFNSEFLSPKNAPDKAKVCKTCGSQCVFEMQLMPNLINCLYEAAEWLADFNKSQVQYGLACSTGWEWISLAVFTCSRSCSDQLIFEESLQCYSD